jgi:hypothetical protein
MGELVKQGDKLDKYRAHLLEGRKLAPEEEKQLARYRKAVSLLSTGYSRLRVIATMRRDPLDPLSESQLYVIVRDAVKLYGNLEEVDKKAERWIAYENYKLLADMARQAGDYGAAIRAQKAADDLLGLFAPDGGKLDPKAFLVPVPMLFSTDPQVLREQEQETEDADYEEA